LPNHGTGCEQTSTEALTAYLSVLSKNLNSSGIVGGRVDIVAHSMGGLVARNFSNSGAYKNTRNRNQGAFRDVITLDTPETGSALAYYLDYVYANQGLNSSAGQGPTNLWMLGVFD
jgi:triacylglycerol esterase/lipase EstA (alpha/beta hydrolase family)